MKHIFFIPLVFFINSVSGQNLVYFADGTKISGKIVEINANKLKIKKPDDMAGKADVRSLEKISFAFNAVGNYLVFSKDNLIKKNEKEEFIAQTARQRLFDVIVDLKGSVIFTLITKETDSEIIYNKDIKIVLIKSDLCCIIRRDGTHEIYCSNQQAQPILLSVKNKIGDLLSQPTKSTTQAPSNSGMVNADQARSIYMPTALEKKQFQDKALEKTREFTSNLERVVDTNTSKEDRRKIVNNTCELFSDGDSRIEVSNINTGVKNKYKIRDYLNRLGYASLQYEKVGLEYADINLVSNFRKATDGTFIGTVTYAQKFTGYIDGKRVYEDITKRTVEVKVKPYQKAINGQDIIAWEVFLGDIGIILTKRN